MVIRHNKETKEPFWGCPQYPRCNGTRPVEPVTGRWCPECGAPMKRKTAEGGPSAGKDYFRCSCYPVCKGKSDLKISDDESFDQWAAGIRKQLGGTDPDNDPTFDETAKRLGLKPREDR